MARSQPSSGTDKPSRSLERISRRFDAGQVIYRQDEPAEECFLVQQGRVRLVKRVREVDHLQAVLRAGTIFGEEALLEGSKRRSTAQALSDVEVLAIDRPTFAALLGSNPEVARRIVEQLVRRLQQTEDRLENTLLRDPPSRVVHALLTLAEGREPDADGKVELRVTPMELASRAGLDVDTLKRTVRQLREGGYLEVHDDRLVLGDVEPLRRLYELLGLKEEVRRGFGWQ